MSVSVVDYVRRPPGIAHRRDAFSIQMADDTMVPWRKPRELLYAEPYTAPVAGDHIVVELKDGESAEGRRSFLRLVVGVTQKVLRLRQYNPHRETEIERRGIAAMHRVIEWDELLRG